MADFDLNRALRDPRYRRSLTPEQLAELPENPAGLIELSDEDLQGSGGRGTWGGIGGPVTTAITCTMASFARGCGCALMTTALQCTMFTFRRWRGCCP